MSLNPFRADPAKQARYARLEGEIGDALVEELVSRASADAGSALPAQDVDELIGRFGLDDVRDLMVLGLGAARRLARPPISDFFVGSIGLEQETGNLILGGNVEFPGAVLAFTLHGEGFVMTRAFSRGTTISVLAIRQAHPCAHCRQYISEFAASRDMVLIDPVGHALSMAELYPWPFDPGYLGEAGIVAGAVPFPSLSFTGKAPNDATVGGRLLAAGRQAHAPYGKCPGAVVLRLKDGRLFAGSTIESVAFNPSIHPLQAAIVDLLAHGGRYSEIEACWLGHVADGRVRYERSTAELLAAIAPEARLETFGWQT